MVMPERYFEYWIDKGGIIYLSEKEIEDKLRKLLPKRPKIYCEKTELACEKGHTYRQIMGLDPLHCECCNN